VRAVVVAVLRGCSVGRRIRPFGGEHGRLVATERPACRRGAAGNGDERNGSDDATEEQVNVSSHEPHSMRLPRFVFTSDVASGEARGAGASFAERDDEPSVREVGHGRASSADASRSGRASPSSPRSANRGLVIQRGRR
jgi:hypothetical protein